MSDVLVALITGAFGVLVVILNRSTSRRLKRVEEAADATRDQVVNGHKTNMREEADERHSENRNLLGEILERIDRVVDRVDRLWERSDRQADQIHDLERTQPTRSRFEPQEPRHRRN